MALQSADTPSWTGELRQHANQAFDATVASLWFKLAMHTVSPQVQELMAPLQARWDEFVKQDLWPTWSHFNVHHHDHPHEHANCSHSHSAHAHDHELGQDHTDDGWMCHPHKHDFGG
jgi:hypothetical protein